MPGLSALCAGYELDEWRCNQLVNHMMEWLPEFCLKWSEARDLNSGNTVRLMREAARRVYRTREFKLRGEFGELLLHIVLRQVFKTQPAISKIFYKDSSNITVKGFDAVHDEADGERLELWLGEAKFYNEISGAITAVVDELQKHTERDYLREEFVAISNKIDDSWPYAAQLKALLRDNTSLDDVFSAACIPVLLTYDSNTVARHKAASGEYQREIEAEILKHYASFVRRKPELKVKVHLLLVPLNTKEKLITELDHQLKSWQ